MSRDRLTQRVVQRVLVGARVASRFAMEFSTPDALKEYLHEHPNADKSRHTVKKPEHEQSKSESHEKGLFHSFDTKDLGDLIVQPTKDPDKLFEDAKDAHEHQLKWLNHGQGLDKLIGAKVLRGDQMKGDDFMKKLDEETLESGPLVVIGPMKSKERSKEKVNADFGGDWSRLGDAVRASVAVDSYDELQDVLKKLKASGLKLARKPKDRFAKPTDAGYRDVLMNVKYPNGHVGELQLHLKPILKAKNEGHKYYEETRSISANAQKEGRTTMTDEETKAVLEANRKMKELYDQAWHKATGSGKTAATMTAGSTKYYDYEGIPAMWEHGKFPSLTPKGPKYVYDLEKFFQSASPISEAEHKKMTSEFSKGKPNA